MFTLSTWFCKKQANKAQEQLSQLSLKKPHERERERETWILTSLNSSSLVILSGEHEHYCERVAERERDCWLMGETRRDGRRKRSGRREDGGS